MNIMILKELDSAGNLRQEVSIDGDIKTVDLSDFNFRLMHWNGDSGIINTKNLHSANITDLAPFQKYIDRWHDLTVEVTPTQEELDGQAAALEYVGAINTLKDNPTVQLLISKTPTEIRDTIHNDISLLTDSAAHIALTELVADLAATISVLIKPKIK